jgi:hypothetical protein
LRVLPHREAQECRARYLQEHASQAAARLTPFSIFDFGFWIDLQPRSEISPAKIHPKIENPKSEIAYAPTPRR